MVQVKKDEVHSNIGLPRNRRHKVDELRLVRARKGQCRPPSMKALVVEALEALVEREL